MIHARAGAWAALAAGLAIGVTCACAPASGEAPARWTVTKEAKELVPDPGLQARIFKALDAARTAGTDPTISRFHVRAATVFPHKDGEKTILGGNTEYRVPEAIHGETSLMNHVINAVGPEEARRSVDFIAFYGEACGGGGSCGDCRDYLLATTRWQDLLIVCGKAGDRTVHVDRFAKGIVPEESFKEVSASDTGLPGPRLDELVQAAREARSGGVRLFTAPDEHLGVAAVTTSGKVYRAAGADDAAFHYRYPVGSVLQQAASYRDYFVQADRGRGSAGPHPARELPGPAIRLRVQLLQPQARASADPLHPGRGAGRRRAPLPRHHLRGRAARRVQHRRLHARRGGQVFTDRASVAR